MITFSVKNFEKFQHYKDRSPPWIKLYNELLDDYEFGRLQDASKLHLVLIWLLASRSENKLPYDPAWIGKRINASETVNLDALCAAGFIVTDQPLHNAEQDASDLLAKRLPREREEGETETEKRQRESRDAASAATPRGCRLSPQWVPSQDLIEWVTVERPGFDWRRETENFRDYWLAKPGRDGVKLDWPRTWQKWMRTARVMPGQPDPKVIDWSKVMGQ